MNKILVGFAVVLVAVVGIYIVQSSAPKQMPSPVLSEAEIAMEAEGMKDAPAMADGKNEPAVLATSEMVNKEEEKMMKSEMVDKEEETMMKDEPTAAAEAALPGAYIPYEASKLAMASAGDVVLFFRASWCPSCRALDTSIKGNSGAIPAGVTILDVNYDTETALKQKYGVTTQHTLVQVAADGTVIKKWSGGSTLASVIEQMQ